MENKELYDKIVKEIHSNSQLNQGLPIESIQPKFLFENIPLYSGFNLFSGEAGIGKSNLAINIALFRASQGHSVIYWTSDSSQQLIESRMYQIINLKYKKEKNIILNNIHVFDKNKFSIPFEKVIEVVNENADLMVIDSASSVYFEGVDSEYEQQLLYSQFMEKFNGSNCCFISIHELNKNKEIKGNASQIYKANNVFTIVRDKNMISIIRTKDRFGYDYQEQNFEDLFGLKKIKTRKKSRKIDPSTMVIMDDGSIMTTEW